MSLAILLLAIVWYEFLTSMTAFEFLIIVRILTVLAGLACLAVFILADHIHIEIRDADLEEVKENLDKQVDPVPVKEETTEFADLLSTQ